MFCEPIKPSTAIKSHFSNAAICIWALLTNYTLGSEKFKSGLVYFWLHHLKVGSWADHFTLSGSSDTEMEISYATWKMAEKKNPIQRKTH